MANPDYYAVLGLQPGASAQQIRQAYRRLARRYHPDRSTEPDAAEHFKKISEAHAALRHLEPVQESIRRAQSDPAFRSTRRQDRPAQKDKTAHRGKTTPQHGEDCDMTAQLSVEELYWGIELKVDPAFACAGRRQSPVKPELLRVNVPRGTRAGQRLRLPGRGTAGADGSKGDIYITVQLRPHPSFHVDGQDLYVDLPLSPWEAVLGATVDVNTPGGRIPVEVTPGTSAGHTFRLENRGLPKSASARGDLYAVARIVSPPERARPAPKWPPRTPAAALSKRWRPVAAYHTTGNAVDVHC